MEKKYRDLCILLIFSFCSIVLIFTFVMIDRYVLSKNSSNCNCLKCEMKENKVINDNKDDSIVEEKNDNISNYVINDDFSFLDKYNDRNVLDSDMNIRTVKNLIIFTGGYYGIISVDNGKLNLDINRYFFDSESKITYKDANFETIYLSHSFDGENVEYIYYDYFMPSGDQVIWVLTDAGNVYFNDFKFLNGDFNTDFFDKFEKRYSNVSDLRIIENIRKNVLDEDYVSEDLAIVVNGEVIEVSKWGN